MEPGASFTFTFNKGKQYCEVHLFDVDPRTFSRWAGTTWGFYWGYNPAKKRKLYSGLFGEIYLVWSRVRRDLVEHEVDHLRWDWIFSRGIIPSPKNEERLVELLTEMNTNLWREYKKLPKRRRR